MSNSAVANLVSTLDTTRILDQASRARSRAVALGQIAARLATAARRTRTAVSRARLDSSTRRLLRLRGASDARPSEDRPRPGGDPHLVLRGKLRAGNLRRDACRHVIISRGRGLTCDGCDEAIATGHVELRARFGDGSTKRFHSRCFSAWYTETQR